MLIYPTTISMNFTSSLAHNSSARYDINFLANVYVHPVACPLDQYLMYLYVQNLIHVLFTVTAFFNTIF